MKLLGTLKFAQIQRDSLKVGERPNRYYDPAAVMIVPKLRLTCEGVFGITEGGEEIIDVHHINHPHSRNRGNANGISFNFLTNYNRIRTYLKKHYQERNIDEIINGIGGENLVIEPVDGFDMDWIDTKIVIERSEDGTLVKLEDVIVTPPCAEFSTFIAGQPIGGAQLRNTLQFLADGTRGFYASMELEHPTVTVQAGDKIYAA